MINDIVEVKSNVLGRVHSMEKKKEFLGRPEEKVIEGLIGHLSSSLEVFGFSKDEAKNRATDMVNNSGISLEKLIQSKMLLLAAAIAMVVESLKYQDPLLIDTGRRIVFAKDKVTFEQAFNFVYPNLDKVSTIIEPVILAASSSETVMKKKSKRKEKTKIITGLKNPNKTNENISAEFYIQGHRHRYETNIIKEQRRADILRYLFVHKDYLYVSR